MKFLIGGLIIFFIIKLGLLIAQKIRDKDQERMEGLLKIIREEIKAKKKKWGKEDNGRNNGWIRQIQEP